MRVANQAAQNVAPDGTLWFVFVGHGAPAADGSDGLLVGVDAQQNTESLMARSVARQELLDVLEQGPHQHSVLFLDACFSGRDNTGDSLVPGLQPVLPVDQAPQTAKRTAILAAAQSDEFAGPLPGAHRPAFSYFMLGALRGWASSGGIVTAEEALEFTRQKLRAIPDRIQTPSGSGALDLVLVRGVSEEDPLPRWNGRPPEPLGVVGGLGLSEPVSGALSQEKEVADIYGLGALSTIPDPDAPRLSANNDRQPIIIAGDESFEGEAIYHFFNRPDLAEEYRQLEEQRLSTERAGTISAIAGGAALLIGAGLFAEAYWLRDVPVDQAEVAHCDGLSPSALSDNCYATERHELLSPWRTSGLITALVGTAAGLFGLSWRRRARRMSSHPLDTRELHELTAQPIRQATLQHLELRPHWTPDEHGHTGLTLHLRW